MKRPLWAPWRIEYIRQPKEPACFLCRALRGRDDRASLLLKRGRACAVVLNRYPYNGGHLMVFPRRHRADLSALSAAERAELMELTDRAVRVLRRAFRPEGFNVGLNIGKAGGAGLEEHVHMHIVPRWNGDTNYMPVLADTRVVPLSLDAVWAELKPLFR